MQNDTELVAKEVREYAYARWEELKKGFLTSPTSHDFAFEKHRPFTFVKDQLDEIETHFYRNLAIISDQALAGLVPPVSDKHCQSARRFIGGMLTHEIVLGLINGKL